MPRLQSRRFATPDEVRDFAHGRAEVLKLDNSVVGRARYEPGWRWTADMPAIAGTPTCQLHHLGYSISGLHARGDAMTARSSTSEPSRSTRSRPVTTHGSSVMKRG